MQLPTFTLQVRLVEKEIELEALHDHVRDLQGQIAWLKYIYELETETTQLQRRIDKLIKMRNLQKFTFEAHDVRTVDIHGQTWFVAKDVCDVLDYTNSRQALVKLDNDEKGVSLIDTPSGSQEMTIINEFGLYSLILGSRKPEARRFKKWITNEVLPSIRKNGGYTGNMSTIEILEHQVKMLREHEDQLQDHDNRITHLETRTDAESSWVSIIGYASRLTRIRILLIQHYGAPGEYRAKGLNPDLLRVTPFPHLGAVSQAVREAGDLLREIHPQCKIKK